MQRLDWSQARRYWEDDRARAGRIDESKDPDALGNVCHSGAPIWFNEYYARYQRLVFEKLLAECPNRRDARALDVGCGAGRWCRLLAAAGYQVEGIDLQAPLIEKNRRRYPDMSFHCTSIQDFVTTASFDLVTTVTVIQHIPFDEQPKALTKIATLIKPGGRLLMLENVADQGAHVFANSVAGWTRALEQVGFSLNSLQRYDYSPAIRLSSQLVNLVASAARNLGLMRRNEGPEVPRAPTAEGMSDGGVMRRVVRDAGWATRRLALGIDERIEPLLIRKNTNLPTIHCGFLFQKNS
jgi:SAM-dependent methyltransferase